MIKSEHKYSIVIPVYNSGSDLKKLHQEIVTAFESKIDFEIIYVDDFSQDESWEILNEIKNSDLVNKITIIRFSKNFGQHAATLCGFANATGDFIMTMDDDLEVKPKEFFKLLENQNKTNNELIYAIFNKRHNSQVRKTLSQSYKLSSKIEGKDKGKGSSFRLLKKSLTDKLVQNHKSFVFIDELCLWYTRKISFVEVEANPTPLHKKRYSIIKLISIALHVMTFSSVKPLKYITRMGFILAFVNFIVGSHFIIKKLLLKVETQGYSSLIVSILFSTGIIILCLGIIAQYIGQAIRGINNVPVYHIDEIKC
jgi:glycosyltransferase involved in cell wall biosynthesis